MPTRRPPRDQDDVDTDVIRLAIADPAARRDPAPGRARAPRTEPITVRTGRLNTPDLTRTAELLNGVLLGSTQWTRLLVHLQAQWNLTDGLVPQRIADHRHDLFQEALTKAAGVDRHWRAREPKRCGPSPTVRVAECGGRDTCGIHRAHLGLWRDAEEAAVLWLHNELPGVARERAQASVTDIATKRGRR